MSDKIRLFVGDQEVTEVLSNHLDCVFLHGDYKPGDPVPAGLFASGARRLTRDEIERDARRMAQAEREAWNCNVDAAKRAKGKR